MLGFLKNLFTSRQDENANVFQQPPAPAYATKPAPSPVSSSAATRMPSAPVRKPVAQPNGANGSIEISLAAVLNGLPMELKRFVRSTDVGDATLSISTDRALSQISTGSVRITFGELRNAAPQLFAENTSNDEALVALPLGEILPRLDPALLARRRNQRQIDVPADISSPFDDRGRGVSFAAAPEPPKANAPARAVTPKAAPPAAAVPADPISPFTRKPSLQPPAPPKAPTPAAPVAPIARTPIVPTAKPVAASPIQRPAATPQASRPVAPVAPMAPKTPAPTTPVTPISPIASAPQASESTEPNSIPVSSDLLNFGASIGLTAPGKTPAQPVRPQAAAPRPQMNSQPASAPTTPARPQETLSVPLGAASDSWNENFRQEIAHLNPSQVCLMVPLDVIEEGMKRGRVSAPWKTVRSWITPPLPETSSANDAAMVELPLKVVAPLFFAHKKEVLKPKQRVAVDEKIPNLFFGFPQPEAAPVQAPEPAVTLPAAAPVAPQPQQNTGDTNYYVWGENSDSAQVDETEFKRKPVVETNFLSRHATPNEVVARAAALEGVAGALVALPDGLMVASKVPSDLNGDTLAAFLPQIFGKVSQCTKELRMGELNNLNFTVGNVPWKIFRVNAIFFAAFGRAGQGLPTAQLATLAAQLDRKKQ